MSAELWIYLVGAVGALLALCAWLDGAAKGKW